MSDNWIVQNLNSALQTWSDKLAEIWTLLTQSPENFKGGAIWSVMTNINGGLKAIGYGLLVLFFAAGLVKTCGSFTDMKKPEHVVKAFIRFALAQGAVMSGMELLTAIFSIVQGIVTNIMSHSGMAGGTVTELPSEIVDKIEAVGMLESIPLWIVTLLGSLLITVLVLCNDPDRIWKNVQAVHVHGHRTDSAGNLCRGANPVCRKELYPFLRRGMSGRSHHRTGLHHLFGVCSKSAGHRGHQPVRRDHCLELCRGTGI